MDALRIPPRGGDRHDGAGEWVYATPGAGQDEVRIAYVLETEPSDALWPSLRPASRYQAAVGATDWGTEKGVGCTFLRVIDTCFARLSSATLILLCSLTALADTTTVRTYTFEAQNNPATAYDSPVAGGSNSPLRQCGSSTAR